LSFYHHNNSILTGVLGIGRLHATRGFVIFMCIIVVKRVFKFVGAKNVCEKVCPSQPVTFVLYRNDHYWRLILLLEGFWCLLLIVLKKNYHKKIVMQNMYMQINSIMHDTNHNVIYVRSRKCQDITLIYFSKYTSNFIILKSNVINIWLMD
jgi:hypothetical protein